MFYLTVKLYGKNGIRGEFRAYEKKALDIFRRHGGEVVAAYVPEPDKSQAEFPDEIQILKMADRDAFEGFMKDPERLALSGEREAVIRKTEVYLSAEIIAY
jgi:hypothetical protein